MIRVAFLADRMNSAGYPDAYVEPVFRVAPLLRERGVALVEESPDVVLATTSRAAQAPPDLPLILYDTTDGGMLWWDHAPHGGAGRRWLKSPRVLGAIKIAKYRDVQFYNLPCADEAYHIQQIYAAAPQDLSPPPPPPVVELNEADFTKIEPGFGFWAFDCCEALASRPLDPGADRPIDVCCAGTVYYDSPAVTHHRHQALAKLGELRDLRVLLGRGRVFTPECHADVLWHSRICVSPWGWGETTIRDYEAIFAGCIVIKPRTDFISCRPCLDERHYVPCAVDFSDLCAVVERVLSRWHDYAEARVANRERFVAARNPAAMADLFARLIRRFVTKQCV
jgi:hypothetical protein